jgi:pSer/pThr/pTyr-binding forkhead associated (FHA) protein
MTDASTLLLESTYAGTIWMQFPLLQVAPNNIGTWLQQNILVVMGALLIVISVVSLLGYYVSQQRGRRRNRSSAIRRSKPQPSSPNPIVITEQKPPKLMGRLRVVRSPSLEVGETWDIEPEKTPFLIGNPRSPKARGKKLTIPITDDSVSGLHMTIDFADGEFMVRDEASSNGTKLDGDILEPQRSYPLQQQHTSEINVALNHIFTFRYVIEGEETRTIPTDIEVKASASVPVVATAQPQARSQPFAQPVAAPQPEWTQETDHTPVGSDPTTDIYVPPAPTPQADQLPQGIQARLVVVESPNPASLPQSAYAVQNQTFWIGRDPSMTLVVTERPISSAHACLYWENGSFFLADYSSNGTWLGGERIRSETPYALRPSESHDIRLALDCLILRFEYTLEFDANAPALSEPRQVRPASDALHDTDTLEETFEQVRRYTEDENRREEGESLPEGLRVQLVVVEENGVETNRRIPITKGNITMGRSPEHDCVVQSPHVSRLHATLFWQRESFYIMDNGSQNGVYVDNELIQPNAPRVLHPMHQYVIHLSRHSEEPTSLWFIYEDRRTQLIDFGGFPTDS